jgi:hypothetical protein
MDEMDELVAWACRRGTVPLPLNGWDYASVWGWDETTNSLFAHLWRNADDSAGRPVRIEPGDYTPVITCPVTLSQHIAMAADCDPWKVLTALFEVFDREKDGDSEENAARVNEAGTVVTIREGHRVWWPPDFSSPC